MKKIIYNLEYIGSKPIKIPYKTDITKSGEYIPSSNVDGENYDEYDYTSCCNEENCFWRAYTKEEVNSIKSIRGLLCPAEFEDEEDLFIPISNIRLHRITIITEIKDEIANF